MATCSRPLACWEWRRNPGLLTPTSALSFCLQSSLQFTELCLDHQCLICLKRQALVSTS